VLFVGWTGASATLTCACLTRTAASWPPAGSRSAGRHQALRVLGNRLVGILHGCLAHRVVYQEQVAWPAAESAA
jgi:hypothetical protein